MKLSLAAALAAFVLPSALAAQDVKISLDQTLVENFDGDAVTQALTTFDATVTPEKSDTGTPFYKIAFPGGLGGVAVPTNCRGEAANTSCTGLKVQAIFSMPEGKTPADIAQMVNNFNAAHDATLLVYDSQGQTRLTRYVIADFGITRTNLAIEFYTFRRTAQAWSEALFGKPAAPPAQGG
jgi:hypothetical protein